MRIGSHDVGNDDDMEVGFAGGTRARASKPAKDWTRDTPGILVGVQSSPDVSPLNVLLNAVQQYALHKFTLVIVHRPQSAARMRR